MWVLEMAAQCQQVMHIHQVVFPRQQRGKVIDADRRVVGCAALRAACHLPSTLKMTPTFMWKSGSTVVLS
jgi:hypothetical protein